MHHSTVSDSSGRDTTQIIAGHLREAIERGDLKADAALPSYRSIASAYGVAINTAREAIRILVSEGHVIVRHGAGTFVRSHSPMIRFTGERYARTTEAETAPFRQESRRLGKEPRIEFLSIERIRPPADVAARLLTPHDGETVLCRRSCHYADGVPIQLISAYLPWSDKDGPAMLESRDHEDIYAYLARLGKTIARSRDEISTRMPYHDELALLEVPQGTPVLDILHTGFDTAQVPLEVTRFVMRGDQSTVLVDQQVGSTPIR